MDKEHIEKLFNRIISKKLWNIISKYVKEITFENFKNLSKVFKK